MKKEIWLILSVALNVLLAGLVLTSASSRHEPAAAPATPGRTGHKSAPGRADQRAAALTASETGGRPAGAAVAGPTPAGALSRSSSRDLKALAAQLREAGWPEETLVSIVTSDFWQKRQKEMRDYQRRVRRGEVDQKAMTDWYQRWQDQAKAEVDGVLGAGAYERYEKKNLLASFEVEGQPLDEATGDKVYALQKDWQKKNQSRWMGQQNPDTDPETYQRESAMLQADYDRQMKEILGEDRYALYKMDQSGGYLGGRNLFGSTQVSDAQRAAAARVMMQFNQQQTELNQLNQAGQIDPQDYQEQFRQLQEEQNRQLKAALGAEAFLRYQQNNDYDFRRIRSELRKQNFTDPQIDAAFQARQAFNDRQQELGKQQQQGTFKGDEYQQQYQAAQDALLQNLRTALGDNGYLGYLKAQDYQYRQLRQYAPVWQLSQNDVDAVWETLHEYQQAVQDYQKQNQAAQKQGQPVDWQQVQQQNASMAQQTEQELRRVLGDERLARLQRAGIVRLGSGGRR